MLFELICGKHKHSDGKEYVKGDRLEWPGRLDISFKNKFKLIEDASPAASVVASVAADVVPKELIINKPLQLGQDVTVLFGAKATPFKVHRNGELFDIVDANGALLTPDPLTKELVVIYLKTNG